MGDSECQSTASKTAQILFINLNSLDGIEGTWFLFPNTSHWWGKDATSLTGYLQRALCLRAIGKVSFAHFTKDLRLETKTLVVFLSLWTVAHMLAYAGAKRTHLYMLFSVYILKARYS